MVGRPAANHEIYGIIHIRFPISHCDFHQIPTMSAFLVLVHEVLSWLAKFVNALRASALNASCHVIGIIVAEKASHSPIRGQRLPIDQLACSLQASMNRH
jgi:hypothetical protein